MATAELLFSEGHPAADGHFPGNPIIPGAVLLAEALRAIEAGASIGRCPFTVKSAKFFGPTRPGDRVRIEYSRSTDEGIRFRCLVKETAVLAGEVKCNVAPTD